MESPHQVDMKNVAKSSKHFFGYFNTLETHSVMSNIFLVIIVAPKYSYETNSLQKKALKYQMLQNFLTSVSPSKFSALQLCTMGSKTF